MLRWLHRPTRPRIGAVLAIVASTLVVAVPGPAATAAPGWPHAPAVGLVVDPASGNVVVAWADRTAVFDPDGMVIAQPEEVGVRSMALLGSAAFVLTADDTRIERIDAATGVVTASWAVDAGGTISIAAADDRIWFAETDGGLASLDPATGTIARSSTATSGGFLGSVAGAPHLLLQTDGSYPDVAPTALLDVSGPTAEVLAQTGVGIHDVVALPPFAADAASGRLYDAVGHEFDLADLSPTGRSWPLLGPILHSSRFGGMLATGHGVALLDHDDLTHEVYAPMSPVGLSPDGTRLYSVDGTGLLATDLPARIDVFDRPVIRSGHDLGVQGIGLRHASSVSVAGMDVTATEESVRWLSVDLDGVPPGDHELVITTPWGTARKPMTVHPSARPERPNDVRTSTSSGLVRVWWQHFDDGGSPVTGFTATALPGGQTCTTEGTRECTFTDLPPGAEVRIQVTATNALGTSDASMPSSPVIVPGPPGPPTDVTGIERLRTLQVSWKAPADTSQLTIRRYHVCWSTDPTVPEDDRTCEVPPSSGGHWLTDLEPGVGHYVTVAAENDLGIGPHSVPSSELVPFDAPTAPRNLVVAPGRLEATVTWDAPLNDGGRPITGSRVCVSTDPAMSAPGTRCESGLNGYALLRDLHGGTTHHVTVSISNGGGWGPVAQVAAVLPTVTPEPPTDISARTEDDHLVVAWTPPVHDGGSPIAGYRVCVAPDTSFAASATVCHVVAGPTSARVPAVRMSGPNAVRVSAINAVGTGPARNSHDGPNPTLAPGAPTSVVATPGNSDAHITWEAPEGELVHPITGWVITPYRGTTALEQSTAPASSRAATVTHLTNGDRLTFRVSAVNLVGAGRPSAPSNPVRPGDPNSSTPFANWDAFVAQQGRDFAGSAGTATSRAPSVAALAGRSATPEQHIIAAMGSPWFEPAVAPAARLYWAYFDRIPDHGGLTYWANRRRTGTTLIRISASFADSSEFRRVYGSLDHAAFVDLIYRNVLGRAPDPSGRAFWTERLRRGASRGQVMVNFSESNEHIRVMARPIDLVMTYSGMLGRAPTATELGTGVHAPLPEIIRRLRLSDAYASRFD